MARHRGKISRETIGDRGKRGVNVAATRCEKLHGIDALDKTVPRFVVEFTLEALERTIRSKKQVAQPLRKLGSRGYPEAIHETRV